MNEIYFAVVVISLALVFDFFNGFNDSNNMVATIISSRAMSVRKALLLASIFNFLGPFIFGTAVAATIGKGIVNPDFININVIIVSLISAIIWDLIAWRVAIPTSSSHALIGALIGAVCISSGFDKINLVGIIKVFSILLISPILGFTFGFLSYKIIAKMATKATPKINRVFNIGQVLSSICLGLAHGTNDAQKTMGVITMALVILKFIPDFNVPIWVILLCALSLALGTLSGGLKIMKTVGMKIFKIKPIHGFTSQICSSSVIIASSLLGGPVSTTHIVSSSVIGIGTAENISRVRWTVVKDIILAWLITMPVSAILSCSIYFIFCSRPDLSGR